MKADGRAPGKAADKKEQTEISKARNALSALLATSKKSAQPSQMQMARSLRKEITKLRARGIGFEEIATHLKDVAGVSISQNALRLAVKRRTNGSKRANGVADTPQQQVK